MMENLPLPSNPIRPDHRAAVVLFPAVTLLMVAATLGGRSISAPVILVVLVVSVVVLGLPHGSLDPLVARRLLQGNRRFTMVHFLVAYSLLAVMCVLGWLAAPNVGLSLFLIISALHFGSDWEQRGSYWGRAAYGVCVVSLPTLRHTEMVREIYRELGATTAGGIVSTSRVVAWVAIAVAVLSLLPQIRLRWRDCLELAVILVGGIVLQPLVFFLCYFCLLHSPRHLVETSRELGLCGVRAIVTAVAPTVGATLLLAALLWRFLPVAQLTGHVLQIVFIGLAALTVPHMLLSEISARQHRSTDKGISNRQVNNALADPA